MKLSNKSKLVIVCQNQKIAPIIFTLKLCLNVGRNHQTTDRHLAFCIVSLMIILLAHNQITFHHKYFQYSFIFVINLKKNEIYRKIDL